ncbi:MAG TPA: roadblock/LC7 domain-containing protein [Thermoanaerobaculia bacterium]|nr:roadblock/LC7 domain-containing protein [Thermoanaerobaculia bacterium]
MFHERLEAILAAIGERATVALVSSDGLLVEAAHHPHRGGPALDLDMLAAELVALAQSISENHREFGGDGVHGLSLVTERLNVSLAPIDDGFFLLAATSSEASLGRVRYELRKAPLQLAGALS